jgi:hypothetical protein
MAFAIAVDADAASTVAEHAGIAGASAVDTNSAAAVVDKRWHFCLLFSQPLYA